MKYLPFFVLGVVLAVWLSPTKVSGEAETPLPGVLEAESTISINSWVSAIYKAEGEDRATYLYGIRSIPYDTPEQARKYCYNTVYNTLVKYRSTRCKVGESDIDCLARRYCPIGVKNDPSGLNVNWKSNVEYFLRKQGEIL